MKKKGNKEEIEFTICAGCDMAVELYQWYFGSRYRVGEAQCHCGNLKIDIKIPMKEL